MPDYTIIEYVWIDGLQNTRSKSRTIFEKNIQLHDIPIWNFDGSSTEQAVGRDSEVYIKPVKLYKDPFRGNNHLMVLCDTRYANQIPHPTNTRIIAQRMFDQTIRDEPWFGFEMEFFMIDPKTNLPIGFKTADVPKAGPYYCGVGASKSYGRNIIEEHYKMCLDAGVTIVGINAEVACGQWEYQIFGKGIDACDDAWMSKYILARVCEKHNVIDSWHPKPILGDCNGSGMHTNFSTLKMRSTNGLTEIENAITLLSKKHKEHIAVYGPNNEKRLTGKHETCSMDEFRWGYGNRNVSIRINYETQINKKGYFEDRRVASSCDMYLVSAKILETTLVE